MYVSIFILTVYFPKGHISTESSWSYRVRCSSQLPDHNCPSSQCAVRILRLPRLITYYPPGWSRCNRVQISRCPKSLPTYNACF